MHLYPFLKTKLTLYPYNYFISKNKKRVFNPLQAVKKVLNVFSWARRAMLHPKKPSSFRGPQACAAHTLRYYVVSRYEELLNTGKLAEDRRFFDKLSGFLIRSELKAIIFLQCLM